MNINLTLSQHDFVRILLSLGILILVILIARLIRKILLKQSEKSKYNSNLIVKAFIKSIAQTLTIFFIALTYIIGKEFLDLPGSFDTALATTTRVLITLTVGIWAFYLVEIPKAWFESSTDKSGNTTGKMLSPVLTKAIQVVVIIIVFASTYQTISNKSITPFLASLGILGAAIALSAQDTFKNFFGSFVMATDKPFQIGERIEIDNVSGTVESIGLRSTRMRTFDDQVITIPNGELANKTILNHANRKYLRRLFTLSLTYDTSPEKMKEALSILKNILDNHEGYNEENPPRIVFRDYSESSLDIFIIYWYYPADYWAFMNFSERVNVEILEKFNEAGIKFAFPTQTIHLPNQNIQAK